MTTFAPPQSVKPQMGNGHGYTRALAPSTCHCGHELVIVCPKGCEDAVAGLVGDIDPISLTRPPRVPDETGRKRLHVPRVSVCNWTCQRCALPIEKKPGRSPKYHESCCTPAELAAIKQKRELNEQRKMANALRSAKA